MTENDVQLTIQPGAYTSAVEQTLLRNLNAPYGLGRIDRAELSIPQLSVWVCDDSAVKTKVQKFSIRTDLALSMCSTFRQMFPAEFNAAETAVMTKKYASQN